MEGSESVLLGSLLSSTRNMNMFPTHFIFNHFPKAGGTSFLAVCKHNIPSEEMSPQLMEQDIRLARPERFERYRLIRGHFGVLTQMGFSRRRYSITLVRNPIATILSTYNFWHSRPEEDPITSQAKRMSFSEFVRHFAQSPTIISNTFTHHFAAVSRDYPGEPDDSELLLTTAKHNLAAFNFVGICEQFDDTVHLLCREVGWSLPKEIPHENRSGGAQSNETIDPETMQILLQHNQLDLQLYDFAKLLFRARCEQPTEDPRPRPQVTSVSGPALTGSEALPAPNSFVAFPIPIGAQRIAQILSVSAQATPQGHVDTITITYEAKDKIAELIAGILVLDSEGNVIWGTNTVIEGMELAYEPGRKQEVSFRFDRQLPPGTYSVSAALARSDRPGFHYDWIDRATVFQIAPLHSVEPPLKQFTKELAKKAFRPISDRLFARFIAHLQLHLQPIEAKLGLLEGTTAGVRDRVAGLHDEITALRREQAELSRELVQLSNHSEVK